MLKTKRVSGSWALSTTLSLVGFFPQRIARCPFSRSLRDAGSQSGCSPKTDFAGPSPSPHRPALCPGRPPPTDDTAGEGAGFLLRPMPGALSLLSAVRHPPRRPMSCPSFPRPHHHLFPLCPFSPLGNNSCLLGPDSVTQIPRSFPQLCTPLKVVSVKVSLFIISGKFYFLPGTWLITNWHSFSKWSYWERAWVNRIYSLHNLSESTAEECGFGGHADLFLLTV